jgi:hypothetical protein
MELCYVVVRLSLGRASFRNVYLFNLSSSADPEKYQNYKGRDAGRFDPTPTDRRSSACMVDGQESERGERARKARKASKASHYGVLSLVLCITAQLIL